MSGNVNVGFVDGRNSSRILKPPGGGYSEIFFTQENDPPKKAPPARRQTSIESILCSENAEIVHKVEQLKIEQVIEEASAEENVTVIPVEVTGIPEEPAEKIEEKPQEEKPVSAKKSRVPPGGYTTAFW